MSKVPMTLRVSAETKTLLKSFAKQENRSMVSYLGLLLTRERDRLANEQIMLKDIMDKLNSIFSKLDELDFDDDDESCDDDCDNEEDYCGEVK